MRACRRPRRAALGAVVVAMAGACFGGPELTPAGKGYPQVGVEFPERAAPGSVHTATVSVRNPGPGDITRLAVAFAAVGAPAAEGLPEPLVGGANERAVVSVTPEPAAVSDDGAVYRFGPLLEGESTTIRFRLEVPEGPGTAANSVTAYDDAEPERIRGARLETVVER